MKRIRNSREIRRRVFHAVTQGADPKSVMAKSLLLAIAGTLSALPYFHYLVFRKEAGAGPAEAAAVSWELLITQLFLVFVLCLLSAMVGFSFSKKLGLPGLGDLKELKEDLLLLVCVAAIMTLLSYFLFDRYFFKVSPGSYPEGLLYLLVIPFKGALTEEPILRLCLVTLCLGVVRHKGAGIILASAAASLFTIKYFQFMGVAWGFNYLFVTQFLLAFTAHLLLGYLFVSKGLYYAMTLKFLFGIKYGVVSWAMRC